MEFEKLNREKVLQAIPEDVKRYFKREIEKAKTNLPGINYRFAQYLLTKYGSIMDIWVASESSTSEIEELKKEHAFCLKAVEDEKNSLWICHDCREIIGVFKNIIQGVTEQDFQKYLIVMMDTCPSCGGSPNSSMKSGFLLSGLTLEQVFGKPVPETDENAGALELAWVTSRGMNNDLKESILLMTKLYEEYTIKDMIKKGRIQGMVQNDKKGRYWDFFGDLTQEEKSRFGFS